MEAIEEQDVISVSWSEFFSEIPPYARVEIKDAFIEKGAKRIANLVDFLLHCTSCEGPRKYRTIIPFDQSVETSAANYFVHYVCRNCQINFKTYAIRIVHSQGNWIAMKFGENPQFGAPLPAKMVSLIGPDRDLLLKGRRCESQGLGIAAFTYYRRVIENQRNRIFDELIRVVDKVSPQSNLIAELSSAKKQTQFSSSVDAIHSALPGSMMINGYNPLKLLHNALSEGVHNRSDEECLLSAGHVRAVLAEFSIRLSETLKDDRELSEAVNHLANPKDSQAKKNVAGSKSNQAEPGADSRQG